MAKVRVLAWLWSQKKAVMGLIVQGLSNKELKGANKIKC